MHWEQHKFIKELVCISAGLSSATFPGLAGLPVTHLLSKATQSLQLRPLPLQAKVEFRA